MIPESDKAAVAELVVGVGRLCSRLVESDSLCAIKVLEPRIFLGPYFLIGDGW